MSLNKKVQTGVLVLLCLVGANSAAAQEAGLLKPVLGSTDNCEDAKARLDNVRILSGEEGVIVLVARLGRGETSRRVNRERLHAIWSYLHRGGRFPDNRLVKAEGERVRGRVEWKYMRMGG